MDLKFDDAVDIFRETPNEETIAAIEEVKGLKNNPDKKTYSSFAELLNDCNSDT